MTSTPATPATVPATGLTVRTFLETLEKTLKHAPDRSLVFTLDGRPLVPRGYHVTEVKRLRYDTVDCGGQANHWQETVVQLWTPDPGDTGDYDYMRTEKFLDIYRRVASHLTIDQDSEILVEYGDLERPAINYHVAGIEERGDVLEVHLVPPHVACKPNERARLFESVIQDEACCTPSRVGACCG